MLLPKMANTMSLVLLRAGALILYGYDLFGGSKYVTVLGYYVKIAEFGFPRATSSNPWHSRARRGVCLQLQVTNPHPEIPVVLSLQTTLSPKYVRDGNHHVLHRGDVQENACVPAQAFKKQKFKLSFLHVKVRRYSSHFPGRTCCRRIRQTHRNRLLLCCCDGCRCRHCLPVSSSDVLLQMLFVLQVLHARLRRPGAWYIVLPQSVVLLGVGVAVVLGYVIRL